jgi:hypothetical protein
MNTFDKDEKDPIAQWIKESSLDSPELGFHFRVLSQLNSSKRKKYEPVISTFGFQLIGTALILLFTSVAIFIPSTESSQILWNQLKLSINRFFLVSDFFSIPSISNLQFSLVSGLSICFFCLLSFGFTVFRSKKMRFE